MTSRLSRLSRLGAHPPRELGATAGKWRQVLWLQMPAPQPKLGSINSNDGVRIVPVKFKRQPTHNVTTYLPNASM